MKKILLLLLIVVSILIISAGSSLASESESILVGFTESKNINEAAKELNISAENLKQIPQTNAYQVKNISSWQKTKLKVDKLFSSKIKYIEPDYQYKIFATPNDTFYSDQWALPKVSASSAWDTSQGSDSNKIAIVDTGIDALHEDMLGKVIAGYDYVNDQPINAGSNSDDYGHGTAVAGVASAITNNSKGIAGLDWLARLMPVKVINQYGYGYSSDIASGIIYAADNGAKIINLSLGGEYPSTVIEEAVNYAFNTKGSLVVAASGNNNGSVSYPAKYTNVIAVGATNQSDNRCSPSDWGVGNGSNYGPELDIVAPGNAILSADYSGTNQYFTASGTSLAAPYVSGLAALLLAVKPSSTNSEIRNLIINYADKVAGMNGANFSEEYGYGRINADRSVKESSSSDPNAYHYQWVSQNAYPSLQPGQGYNFVVNVRNTGTTVWKKDAVNLATDRPQDRVPNFVRADLTDPYGHPSHWISPNRVEMLEESVAPGETATFSFWMSAPTNMSAGTYRQYFRLVADNITWMEDYGIYWNITVIPLAQAYYPNQWVSQNAYPTFGQVQGYNFVVNVQNTGTATWQRGTVNLGTNQPQDRTPVFLRADINDLYGHPSHWISPNRVEMLEESIAPGETATFSFWMSATADTSPGVYHEHFRMIADGITWMQDWGIYWDVQVN